MSANMEVTFNCEALINAVNMIMDPQSTTEQRTEAQQFCDEFKEKSQYCVSCGLKLAAITEPTVVRRLGLQLIEHVAKYRWTKISADEKTFMKNRVMNLIAVGTKPALEEETCIKDAIVRIVVEIAKHSWPEHWPKMLTEMQSLSQKGGLYAELVLLILLRLSEDVASFKLLPSDQGDRLKYKLDENVPTILAIVIGLLNEHVKMYKLLKNDPKQQYKFRTYCRVITVALLTLQEYFDWIGVSFIHEQNFNILTNLWRLFNESHLQLEAADCLLVALNRFPGNKPLLVQFAVFAAAVLISPVLANADEVPTEENYLFLKRRCELLCLFGLQLCHTVGLRDTVTAPPNFESYLDALLAFTAHSSQYLSCQTQVVWKVLFSHRKLSRNPLVLAKLPAYLLATRTKLVKVGFPSKNNSPSCAYSRFDFATDEDFYVFLKTFRDEQKQTIDAACLLDQKTCFQTLAECLKNQLMFSSVDSEPDDLEMTDSTTCTSPHSFLQWEAMTFFNKIIITNLFNNCKTKDIPVKNGIELLQQLLNFKTKDPHILACVQTNISTLFPFLNLKNDCLPQVISKLLEIIEDVQAPAIPSLKNARKYACTSINRMCRENAAIVLPSFETLFKNVQRLIFDEQLQLSEMEKSKLIEGMVVLINLLPDYKKQKSCVDVLMAPVAEFWLSKEMKTVFADAEAFITYIGADLPMTDTTEGPTYLNRSKMLNCVGTMVDLLRWIRCPSDLEKARAGGFMDGVMSNGRPFCRNPCAEQVLKLLDNLLLIIRAQLNLFLPSVVSKMGKAFADALDADVPKHGLDIYDPPEFKSALEQMQNFFCVLFDSCLYILGRAGPSFTQDFFTIEDLGNKIVSSIFVNLENLPVHRYMPIFRFFLRPFVKSCPEEYIETYLCPILSPLLTNIQAKLPYKWHAVDLLGHLPKMQIRFKNKLIPELPNPDSSKIKPSQIGQLTREVLTFLLDVCSVHETDTFITDERAERKDVHFVSRKDKNVVICTAESDDDAAEDHNKNDFDDEDNCFGINDEDASTAAEHIDASSVVSDESDCYAATVDPDDGYSFKHESADASVACSDSDGEMAAEVPQTSQLLSKEVMKYLKYSPLSMAGTCLMKDEDIRYTLLRIVFSCLGYKAYYCRATSTRLCWPMLKEVINEPLSTELVTDLFAAIFYAFPKKNHDKSSINALVQLAFHVYESLRPRHVELKEMMAQVPKVSPYYLDRFDERLMNPPLGKPDYSLLALFQRLLAAVSHVGWNYYEKSRKYETAVPLTKSQLRYLEKNFDLPLQKLEIPHFSKVTYSASKGPLKSAYPAYKGPYVPQSPQRPYKRPRNPPPPFKYNGPPPYNRSRNAPPPSKYGNSGPPPYNRSRNAPPPSKYGNSGPPPYKKSRNVPPPSKYGNSGPPPYKKSRNVPPPKYGNSGPPPYKKSRNAPSLLQTPSNPVRPSRRRRSYKQRK